MSGEAATLPNNLLQLGRTDTALVVVAAGLVMTAPLPPPLSPSVDDREIPSGYSTVGFEMVAGFDTWEKPYRLPLASVTIPPKVRALHNARDFTTP
jgi:hypothetical protein